MLIITFACHLFYDRFVVLSDQLSCVTANAIIDLGALYDKTYDGELCQK